MQRATVGSQGASRLGQIDLFAELSTGQRQMLGRLVDELTASAGETIMQEGDFGYEVLVIEEGTADVLQSGARINAMGPGDFFGELAVLDDGATRTATVIASAPLRAIVLTSHFIREVRDRMPTVGEQIDRAAARRREHDAHAG